MLQFLSKAGDSVEIVCPDDSPNPPTDFLSYPISYTPGFRFSLYNSICLSYDHKLVGVSGPLIRACSQSRSFRLRCAGQGAPASQAGHCARQHPRRARHSSPLRGGRVAPLLLAPLRPARLGGPSALHCASTASRPGVTSSPAAGRGGP